MELHASLCHPGVTRMSHFVRARNLPYSIDEIRRTIACCAICAKMKPRFFKPETSPLIKSTKPWERISLDFKGPLPSNTKNIFLLDIIDEYSRFPFSFACKDVSACTVIQCLTQLFQLFDFPAYVHSDRGTVFMSKDLKEWLHSKGIATSTSTAYNARGNGQCYAALSYSYALSYAKS